MSKGTKRRGFGRFYTKIIEVCGFCTSYGVDVPSTYAVALIYEDYDVARTIAMA
jgi:hypothetical protein